MSQVFIGYGDYGIDGVDDEFIRFIFDVTLGLTTKKMDSEVGVVITDDAQMQKLNRSYRGQDKSTNVLSFHNTDWPGAPTAESGANYLGDIYISSAILLQEAKQLKVAAKERFAQLFAHGLLHLLGFDHEKPAEIATMEALEDQIMQLVL